MKVIISLVMLCVSLTILGQGNTYSHKTEQEAIKSAYNVLKVYYPSNELCVSDSIYDLDWNLFADMVDDKTKQNLISHRIEKNSFGIHLLILMKYLHYSVLTPVIVVNILQNSQSHTKE